jgi:DNA adenine methylase
MSWIGGKKALRDVILQRFPLYYEKYIEVFGGGGWVLFHKQPGNDFEVYNDFNGLLTNLYRCVRDQPQALISALRYGLNSREDFDLIKAALAGQSCNRNSKSGVVLSDHPLFLCFRPHQLRKPQP